MLTRLTLVAALTASTAIADPLPDDIVQDVFDELGMAEMLEIMREEGVVYGAEIGADLFEGRVTVEWTELVSDIYDTDRMATQVKAGLGMALSEADVDAILAFFRAEPGDTVISLELAARRALLDDTLEEAAQEAAATAIEDDTDRYQMIKRFVEVNDLIETNVVGAMNSNYAFYTGLMDGGALPIELTEEQILTDVWSQEAEIRQNTTEWVYTFLMLAYQPLSDDDLETYIAFSESEPGQDLNQALFSAFDVMFEDISRALGLGAARSMGGEDI